MDETKAIALCLRRRDPIGFEFLVRKYQREALKHAAALLGNREEAADACQESFASAFASLVRLPQLTASAVSSSCVRRIRSAAYSPT